MLRRERSLDDPPTASCGGCTIDKQSASTAAGKVAATEAPHRITGASSAPHSQSAVAAVARNAGEVEDFEMDTKALTERVPTTLSEVKNHPLWVMERFLTKTQMIHPRHPVKGFIGGECVFPRTCVQDLRSAERWKTERRRKVLDTQLPTPAARIHSRAAQARLKADKEANKKAQASLVVENGGGLGGRGGGRGKSGGRRGRRQGPRSVEEAAAAVVEIDDDENTADDPPGDIAVYGEWQTELWSPPAAVGGIVPKNERGNVDLYGGASPPPGTVHVNLPRITRVARALGLDFAPALVGFDFQRGGKTLPMFEGVVVCLEFEKQLVEAFIAEEERLAAAEAEKERKEAAKRWRVLLSAIWTRLSLREEFNVDGNQCGGNGGFSLDNNRQLSASRPIRGGVGMDSRGTGEHGGAQGPRMTAAAAVAAAVVAKAKAAAKTGAGGGASVTFTAATGVEDVEDGDDVPMVDLTEAEPGGRKRRRRSAALGDDSGNGADGAP
jgi:xeroderma pigmentosum group C-complementing protein